MSKACDSEISKSKISNRNREEFDRLFTKYFVQLAKYAYKYVSNVAVAKDLTQSVFLKIWELNGKWNPEGTIRAYLYIAVKNNCLNYIKHNKIVEKSERHIQFEETTSLKKLKWEDDQSVKLLNLALKQALAKMPKTRREIFELSRNEGLTYNEIAQIKGIKRKTVENHMGNALRFLKEELKDWL